MDTELLKILADIGAGGISLFLIARQSKVLTTLQALVEDHEERITVLEARKARRRRRS